MYPRVPHTLLCVFLYYITAQVCDILIKTTVFYTVCFSISDDDKDHKATEVLLPLYNIF